MKKKTIALILVSVLAALFLTACESNVSKISAEIAELSESDKITQEQLDALFDEYQELSDSEKEKVENYGDLKKYEDVDIEAVNELQDMIEDSDDTTEFSEFIKMNEKYKRLNENEKNLIDIFEVEKKVEVTDLDKAAIAAAQNVKSCMKSKSSFVIRSVSVKDDVDKMSFYWVLIEYSGDNSFGASMDYTSCFGITPEFEDPFFPLAQLTGIEAYLNDTTSYNEYTKCSEEEVVLDEEKIQYYLNKSGILDD
ncbi:MAG: hypothetical protein HFG80_05140 [Eubacterium sp.]|nr:hypothetical protein [Eubacterium sp.]